MALTETQVEDKIEVVGDHKAVQVRTATVIAEMAQRSADHSIVTSYNAQLNQVIHGVTLTSQVKAPKYKQYAMLFGQTQ